MTNQRTALWVHAHPSRHSLNHMLFEHGTAYLERTHHVLTSDLYALGWQPTLSQADLGAQDSDGRPFVERTRDAHDSGTLAADIRAEQDKLRRADLIILQFPLWWHGMPAILKGWFDRVFINGFAFNVEHPTSGRTLKYGEGGLTGRRALTVVTAGDRWLSFGDGGVNGHLEALLFPLLHGTLWYTGIAPLRPHLISDTDRRGFAGAAAERDRLFDRLTGAEDEEPIGYRTLRNGGYDRDQRLRLDAPPLDLGIHLHHPASPSPVG